MDSPVNNLCFNDIPYVNKIYTWLVTPDQPADARTETIGLFMAVHCRLTAKIGEVLAGHDLSNVDFDVMQQLACSPGRALRMTALAGQVHLSTSGITRVVDRLDRAGLVTRQACVGDRRVWNAVLTNKGERRVRALRPEVQAAVDRWFTGQLEPAQLDAVLDALRTVYAAMEGEDGGVPVRPTTRRAAR